MGARAQDPGASRAAPGAAPRSGPPRRGVGGSCVPVRSRPASSSAVRMPSSSPSASRFAPASARPERSSALSVSGGPGGRLAPSSRSSGNRSSWSARKKPWVARWRTRGPRARLSAASRAPAPVSASTPRRFASAFASSRVPGRGSKRIAAKSRERRAAAAWAGAGFSEPASPPSKSGAATRSGPSRERPPSASRNRSRPLVR